MADPFDQGYGREPGLYFLQGKMIGDVVDPSTTLSRAMPGPVDVPLQTVGAAALGAMQPGQAPPPQAPMPQLLQMPPGAIAQMSAPVPAGPPPMPPSGPPREVTIPGQEEPVAMPLQTAERPNYIPEDVWQQLRSLDYQMDPERYQWYLESRGLGLPTMPQDPAMQSMRPPTDREAAVAAMRVSPAWFAAGEEPPRDRPVMLGDITPTAQEIEEKRRRDTEEKLAALGMWLDETDKLSYSPEQGEPAPTDKKDIWR